MEIERLRSATEDDAEAALRGSYVEHICGNAESAALLEFWHRVLDRFLSERVASL